MEKGKEAPGPKGSHLLRDLIETVVITLIIFLIIHQAILSYHVEGPSMKPSLNDNEFAIVNKISYLFQQPARGDVIVFHFPCDNNTDFIKRVIGLPGDTVRTDQTHVWVNGVQLNEPYISAPSNPTDNTWKVPADQYFVMGDNRPVSDDSRYWTCRSFVKKDEIVGRAVLVFWPLSEWGGVDTHPDVFAQIKPGK